MKLMGIVPILLLLGVGITSGIAAGQVSVGSSVIPPTAQVGERVAVTLSLSNQGGNPVDVTVTPVLPMGVRSDIMSPQTVRVDPSNPTSISYPIWADVPGNYRVTTQIFYVDASGTPTNLNMQAVFNVMAPMATEAPGMDSAGNIGEGFEIDVDDGDNGPQANENGQPEDLPGYPGEFSDSHGPLDQPPGSGHEPGEGPREPCPESDPEPEPSGGDQGEASDEDGQPSENI